MTTNQKKISIVIVEDFKLTRVGLRCALNTNPDLEVVAECEDAKFVESDEIVLSDIHQGVNSGVSMAIHFAEQLKAGEQND